MEAGTGLESPTMQHKHASFRDEVEVLEFDKKEKIRAAKQRQKVKVKLRDANIDGGGDSCEEPQVQASDDERTSSSLPATAAAVRTENGSAVQNARRSVAAAGQTETKTSTEDLPANNSDDGSGATSQNVGCGYGGVHQQAAANGDLVTQVAVRQQSKCGSSPAAAADSRVNDDDVTGVWGDKFECSFRSSSSSSSAAASAAAAGISAADRMQMEDLLNSLNVGESKTDISVSPVGS